MAQNIIIRKINKGDESEISDLIREAFNSERSKTFWDWRFHQNPAGKHMMFVATLNGNKIIGVGGGIPHWVKTGDTEVLASLMGDLYVVPQFRSIQVFFKLAKTAIHYCAERGVQFSFGIPNPIGATAASQTGYKKIAAIYWLTGILDATPYVKEKIHWRPVSFLISHFTNLLLKILYYRPRRYAKNLMIEKIQYFDQRFDLLWDRVKDGFRITSIRRSNFLNWRYIKIPMDHTVFAVSNRTTNDICGFVVLKITEEDHKKKGLIIDCFYAQNEPRVLNMLIDRAIDFFRQNNCHIMRVWALNHMHLFKYLVRRCFIPKQSSLSLLVRNFSLANDELLFNSRNWFFTQGDSDQVGSSGFRVE